jgi:hypothetical protein
MGTQSAKKLAAAVAAVIQYLSEAQAAAPVQPVGPLPAPAPVATPWGLAGRQESMTLRDIWQRRIPKSW